jgi:taurine transport system permease protein
VKKYQKDKLYQDILLPFATILMFLFVWQVVVMTGKQTSLSVTPIQVFETFIYKLSNTPPDGAKLMTNILVSLETSCIGLILGICIGTPLGWLMGWYTLVNRYVKPLFELIRPIPPIAWIPLSILWIGVGLKAKVLIIFLSSFTPCVINASTGINLASEILINLAKTFGASNFDIFIKIGIPSALPITFAGMKIALGNAWSTLVAAELIAANAGLGYMITMGRQFSRPDIIIIGMLTIGLLGYILTNLFELLEKRIIRWRVS